MNAQGASLRQGRQWTVRPQVVAAITVAAFAVGLIAGRQPILDAARAGAAAVPGEVAASRSAERDSLIDFRAGERVRGAYAPWSNERDYLIHFRSDERSVGTGTTPNAERDSLIDFRAGERASLTDTP